MSACGSASAAHQAASTNLLAKVVIKEIEKKLKKKT